jgi:hypothetical protein
MPSFIKKITAQKCPVHQAILELCGRKLVEKGYFSKAEVLDETKMHAMAEAVRWDYITDFLRDPELGHGIEILPVAQKFFSSTKAERARAAGETDSGGRPVNFGQYLAGGHGKKTAGYARVSLDGGLLALKRAQNYRGLRNGVGAAFDAFREAVMKDPELLRADVRDALEQLQDKPRPRRLRGSATAAA